MSNPSQYQQSFTPKLSRTNIDLDQQYVDHSYIDYANVERDNLRMIKEAALLGNGSSSIGLGGSTRAKPSAISEKCNNTFPYKLHDILDLDDLSVIIDWMPHGRAFIVKRPKTIAAQVLTRFFKQTKLRSFTRQLNLWGFKRITRGTDTGAYYHELFLRGRPDLALRMKRHKIKGNGTRATPCPEQEPNFYYDYPHIPRVPTARVPMPLFAEDPSSCVMSPALLSQISYGSVPQATHSNGVVSPIMSSVSAASNCYSSLDAERNSNPKILSRLSAESGSEFDSRRYMHRADSLPAAGAPQSFHSMDKGDTEDDELSYANRRLMERLAALAPAPAPDAYIQITRAKPQQLSFTSTADGSSVPSLQRANGFVGHWQGSRQSDRSQDANFQTATRAMRKVQPLEGLARSQQNNAEALVRYYMSLCNLKSLG